jgi:DNA helicase II / ATP-dependent DNA helicase PcrA
MPTAEEIKQAQHNYFAQVLRQLNAAQWEAVRQLEGPVMAIAGPGTGKTHMLTARIGHILQQTDTQPHNILCLTFTEAGVQAMRSRLTEFIGAEAHRVHIFTFHSFCNKIIQENIDLFGQRRLQPLSDLERIDTMRAILSSLSARHILRRASSDVFHYEQHLSALFQQMKKEAWTADFINDKIDEYLRSLPNRAEFVYQRNSKQYKAGDVKQAKIDEVTEKMERLRAAANLAVHYKYELEARGRYDFEDMIIWVLDAFQQNEYLLRKYQEQYLYVLIDEFQDTNGAQKQLIDLIISYWENNPNIFVVGDDDQAIYEFQGARLQNTLDFFARYSENIALVQLQENYRSTQQILDASKALIDQNQIRLVTQIGALSEGKTLFAVSAEAHAQQLDLRLRIYPNQLQEEIDIVQRIGALKDAGCPLHEIAIIFARHRQARNIVRLLERKGIAYQTKRRINILQLPLMRNLRQLLRYFALELQAPRKGEIILFELLHYEFIGILPQDLAALSKAFTQRSQLEGKRDYTWYDFLQDEALISSLSLQRPEAVSQWNACIHSLVHQAQMLTVPEFVERLYNHSGILHYALQSPQKAWHLEVLHTFFDFVQREADRRPALDLDMLLDTWQKMEDNRVELGLQKTNYAEQGVQLITAHSAKGLEFKHVFMINCLRDLWEPSNDSRAPQFGLPDTISFSDETDALEASRRLFYVGMTRAKQGLYLSYFERRADERPEQRSLFIDELLTNANQHIAVEYIQLPASQLIEAQALLIYQPTIGSYQNALYNNQRPLPLPIADQIPADHIRALLADFRMSASALNTYLYCPLAFYYEYVLRIPHTVSQQALFGTALHEALQKLIDAASRHAQKLLPSSEQFIIYAQEALTHQQLPANQKSYYRELIQQQMPDYYEQRSALMQAQVADSTVQTERIFKLIEIDGVPISGVIDKMLLRKENGQTFWAITDYKTGKLQSDRLQAPNEQNPLGGIYWRQLVFYKILIEQANFSPYAVKYAEIDYLSPNAKGTFEQKSITLNAQAVDFMKGLIKKTYQSIISHDFSQACRSPNCKWCAFVERVKSPDSFNNDIAEALDEE